MSVYEVHLGSWRPGLAYRELADQLTAYVVELGFTHVEFLPVMEHPFGGSWGYQVTGYYAPTARFGDPDDFRHLVDRLHQAGIGVILDWVPAHFPKDEWALARFDGTPLYEHPDPRRGEHPDWGTYVFDFGRREVRNFLVANALYWCDEFHVDGLRVDAVASMLYLDYSREDGQWAPNQYGGRENLEAIAFLQEMNATVYKHHPGVVMIAEESTACPGVTRATADGGLGFGFKWNMGWMHDTLLYTSKDPIYRQHHHHQLTFSLVYAWSENYVLPISHDEVVHGKGSLAGKMPGDPWQRLANVRALLAYMWAHPGKQLLFMGCELADDREWSEERGLDWYLLHDPARAGVQRLVRDLNAALPRRPGAVGAGHRRRPASAGSSATTRPTTRWRSSGSPPDGSPLVCVANFSALPHEDYRIGLPRAGDLDRGAQHRRRTTTAAPAWATWARCAPRTCPGTGCRPRRGCGCRRSARSGCGPTSASTNELGHQPGAPRRSPVAWVWLAPSVRGALAWRGFFTGGRERRRRCGRAATAHPRRGLLHDTGRMSMPVAVARRPRTSVTRTAYGPGPRPLSTSQ